MRVYSLSVIKRLKELRREGVSIQDLMRIFSMPKTSVWHHIQGIKLSSEHIKFLKSKGGMMSMMRRKNDLEKAEKEAKELLSKSDRYYYAILSVLHWTEGNSKNFSFVNTSPDMIKVYLNLLKKCFNIPKDRVAVTVRYFTGMDRESCLEYWSKVTKISKDKINMYYNDGGKRGKSPYGMCRVTVRKGGYLFKVIQVLIKEIASEINAPVAQFGRAAPS